MKKFPWFSLGLLGCSYGIFSYSLRSVIPIPVILIGVLVFISVQLVELTPLPKKLEATIANWVSNDVLHLLVIVTGAFLLSVALAFHHIFENILLIAAAEVLARLDLRRLEYGQLKSLGVLIVVSLTGLVLGRFAFLT